jgi:hypothetical protein
VCILAQRDRPKTGQDKIHLVVTGVNVGTTLRDLDDMNIRHATFATGHDPLNMAERTVNGLRFVSMVDKGLLHFSFASKTSPLPGDEAPRAFYG